MNDKILFYAFPGQSEDVRVGLGLTTWIIKDGEQYPSSISLKSEDWSSLNGAEEMSPIQFVNRFPPLPGSKINLERIKWIAKGGPECRTEKDLILRKKVEDYLKRYATGYQIEQVARLLYIVK